jgi:hypothetical protein
MNTSCKLTWGDVLSKGAGVNGRDGNIFQLVSLPALSFAHLPTHRKKGHFKRGRMGVSAFIDAFRHATGLPHATGWFHGYVHLALDFAAEGALIQANSGCGVGPIESDAMRGA